MWLKLHTQGFKCYAVNSVNYKLTVIQLEHMFLFDI